jgi:hypothetical protein
LSKDLKFNIIARIHGDCLSTLQRLVTSVMVQTHRNLTLHLAVDESTEEVNKACKFISENHWRTMPPWLAQPHKNVTVEFWPNETNERLYSIRNTCRVLDTLEEESIIGVIDTDDQLCEARCLEWVNNSYDLGAKVVWTSNIWEPYSVNLCSDDLDDKQDVYKHRWVSSHFRTFLLSTYKKINKANFKDDEGKWMKRCEDQTLMLPIIKKIHQEGGGTHHIDRPCYLYRGYQKIGGEAHQYQQGMEKFIRDRGYIE